MKQVSSAPLHILIVDNDEAAAHALAAIVRSLGHKATALTSSVAAVRVASRFGVDVIIADERMPDMRGSEILATLARLHPSTFRVLTSAFVGGELMFELLNRSRLEYVLLKPFRIADVHALLRTAQNERRVPARRASSKFGPSSIPRDATGAIVIEA